MARDDAMLIGVFSDAEAAEDAIIELKDEDFDAHEISVITRNRDHLAASRDNTDTNVADGAVSGAATGGVIGGLAGLLIGLGAITIPGLGAILIGGPIAAALGLTGAAATTLSGTVTGALAGGLVGALVDLGVPEEDARVYEERIREGGVVVAVPIRRREEDEVRDILVDNGADRVCVFTMNTHTHRAAFNYYIRYLAGPFYEGLFCFCCKDARIPLC